MVSNGSLYFTTLRFFQSFLLLFGPAAAVDTVMPGHTSEDTVSNALPGGTAAAGTVRAQEDGAGALSTMPWTEAGRNPSLAGLPLQLDVSIPISNFRVRDLVSLDKGTILASEWPYAEDVPVYCGGEQLIWAEFEVVDDVLAVRVTRVL